MGALLLALGLLVSAADASSSLDDDPDFKAGRKLYEQLEFEKAIIRFQQATRVAGRPPKETATLHMWIGVSYGQLGDFTAAGDAFRDAVALDPEVTFPVPVSPKVDTLLKNAKSAKAQLADDAPDTALDGRKAAPASGGGFLEPALWGAAAASGIGSVVVALGALGLGVYALSTYSAATNPSVPQTDAKVLEDTANLAGGAAAISGGIAFGLMMTTMVIIGIALSGSSPAEG